MSRARSDLDSKTIFTLDGALRPYAWGDTGAIPALLGIDVEGPVAEYWMGAHQSAPSHVVEASQGLDEMIATDPVRHLGADRVELPYLMKVLAAAAPLSIQTHPTAAQAAAGFAAENAANIPLDAAQRVFRDANAKPELVVALHEFSARIGFRPLDEARRTLDAIAQAEPRRWANGAGDEAIASLEAKGYEALLRWLVSQPETTQRELAGAAVRAASSLEPIDAETITFAARHHDGDIGIVMLVLLNPVTLQPGEAVFLDAGTLHAYIQGLAVEVMANSDNVVRGGLTAKHIDVERLLAMVDTTPEAVSIQHPSAPTWRYDTAEAPFSLVTVTNDTYDSDDAVARVVFVSNGSATVTASDDQAVAATGTALYVPADSQGIRVEADGVVWVAEGR